MGQRGCGAMRTAVRDPDNCTSLRKGRAIASGSPLAKSRERGGYQEGRRQENWDQRHLRVEGMTLKELE